MSDHEDSRGDESRLDDGDDVPMGSHEDDGCDNSSVKSHSVIAPLSQSDLAELGLGAEAIDHFGPRKRATANGGLHFTSGQAATVEIVLTGPLSCFYKSKEGKAPHTHLTGPVTRIVHFGTAAAPTSSQATGKRDKDDAIKTLPLFEKHIDVNGKTWLKMYSFYKSEATTERGVRNSDVSVLIGEGTQFDMNIPEFTYSGKLNKSNVVQFAFPQNFNKQNTIPAHTVIHVDIMPSNCGKEDEIKGLGYGILIKGVRVVHKSIYSVDFDTIIPATLAEAAAKNKDEALENPNIQSQIAVKNGITAYLRRVKGYVPEKEKRAGVYNFLPETTGTVFNQDGITEIEIWEESLLKFTNSKKGSDGDLSYAQRLIDFASIFDALDLLTTAVGYKSKDAEEEQCGDHFAVPRIDSDRFLRFINLDDKDNILFHSDDNIAFRTPGVKIPGILDGIPCMVVTKKASASECGFSQHPCPDLALLPCQDSHYVKGYQVSICIIPPDMDIKGQDGKGFKKDENAMKITRQNTILEFIYSATGCQPTQCVEAVRTNYASFLQAKKAKLTEDGGSDGK